MDDPFDDIEMELAATPLATLGTAGLLLMALVALGAWLAACAMPRPIPLPPLPPPEPAPTYWPAAHAPDAGAPCPPFDAGYSVAVDGSVAMGPRCVLVSIETHDQYTDPSGVLLGCSHVEARCPAPTDGGAP